jgi:hypothetical protein
MKCLVLLALALAHACPAEWRAGAAAIDITPRDPIWMAGYAARHRPSEGVAAPLFVKALAIEDSRGGRAVILTSDIIGFPRTVADEIAVGALKRYGVERRQLLLNSSHTHSGPVVYPNLDGMYPMDATQSAVVRAFTRRLVGQCVEVIGAALAKLAPASLQASASEAKFAVYRRLPQPDGSIRLAPNPAGPVEHRVGVLQVRGTDGTLSAVLFSYSCHNTTSTGEFLKLHGDYAGFAQAAIERAHPGAVALFATGCAGDQNPNPRGSLEYAKSHGEALAAAVNLALAASSPPLAGRIRSGFRQIDLPFQPFGANDFEKERASSNRYAAARAEDMLNRIANRRLSRTLPYPIQLLRIGPLAIVALGGEVSVRYCSRLRAELTESALMVFGYSNDVMCYIPDAQQAVEGGYEGKDSFIYYRQPAPLAPAAEDEIVTAVKTLSRRVK